MLRSTDNPDSRYPADRPLEDDRGLWVVAHVKSRQEKALAHDLARMDVPYYLPMVEKRTRRRDNNKLRKSIALLFPGYLALALEKERWEEVYATRRVAELLSVVEQDQFVHELEQIRRTLEAGLQAELVPTFQMGQRVRVRSGPLMGLEGEVYQVSGQMQFVIRVQMFQQAAVRVEMDERHMEAL